MVATERRLCLTLLPERTFAVHVDWHVRGVILHWLALTSVANVTAERWIVLRLGWPPVVDCKAYLPKEEDDD